MMFEESVSHSNRAPTASAAIGARLAYMERVTRLMDGQFSILGYRFGFDALVGLIPGVGDFASSFVGLYVIWQAHLLGVPNRHLGPMMLVLVLDFFIGSIPVLGDLFDFFFHSNEFALKRTKRYLHEEGIIVEMQK